MDVYDWTTYKQEVKKGEFDIAFYGWTGDNGDPDNFMALLSDKDPAMNIAHFADPAYLDLIAQGKATPAGADRDAIYKQLEQIQVDQNPWLVISHAKLLSAYNPYIHGYYYHVTGNIFLSEMTKSK
jgi:peptide/nickel transport system substrate-binding protein